MMHLPLCRLPKSSALNEAIGQINAIRLAELNARTRTIRALTGLSEAKIKRIIFEISNRNPPRGRGLENIDEYINNKTHRRHVSFIIQNYQNAIKLGVSHAEAVINSYIVYLENIADQNDKRTFVDIDHAFCLIMETNKRAEYDMFDCGSCKSRFFYHKYELNKVCPYCTDKKEALAEQLLTKDIPLKIAVSV